MTEPAVPGTPTPHSSRAHAPWTLRRRLVVAVVALVAVLSVVVGGVTVLVLRQNLAARLDDQLVSAMPRAAQVGPYVGAQPPPFDAILRGEPAGSLAVFVTDGDIRSGNAAIVGSEGLKTKLSDQQVSTIVNIVADGTPKTVDLDSLGRYRFEALQVANGVTAMVGLPTREMDATILQLVLIIAIVTVAALIAAVVVAAVLVRITLRPLDRVAATATRVSELPLASGDVRIDARVPDADTDARTEVGQVGAALNRLLDHVGSALEIRQRSERKVRQFVADASHELRTPLASIRGYSELTRRSGAALPDDVRHSLGRIESESIRMTTLVEELLLLARLDEGRELHLDSIDLTALLRDAVSDAVVAGPDHEWSLDAPEDDVRVLGDGARLHQVFANLLANARAHTPAGTHVAASVEPGEDTVLVSVTDDGPGIEPGILPTLFERFVRGDSSRSRRAGSTGLGLAIVQAIVEAHGGIVEVSSGPGRTRFDVRLPRRPREHDDARPVEQHREPSTAGVLP